MPIPTVGTDAAVQHAGSCAIVLLEIEHLARHWETRDHSEAGKLIAQALRAAARLTVGEDPALIAAQFKRSGGDHDHGRLVAAAGVLLAALEDASHLRELQDIRGDLAKLQTDVEHMRRTIEGRPAGNCEFWY